MSKHIGKNKKSKKKSTVYLWTGLGWGKTTSALGVALRSVGHGKKVLIIQFMKGWKQKVGEYRVRKKLGRQYEIHQVGRKGWVNLNKPTPKDKLLAQKGLDLAKKLCKKKKPFLLILDEINIAVASKLLKEKDVIDFLNSNPAKNVYLTGRYASKGLKKRADYVNEIKMLKGPKKLAGEKGIDF